MQPPPLSPVYPPQQPAPRGGGLGCAAKGCVVLLIIGLIFGGLAGGAAYWAWKQARGFTDDHSIPVPILDVTDAQAAEVSARIKAFTDTIDQKKRATLTLSDADLNAVVARDPKYKDARGRVFFAIVKDALHTRVSVPLDGIPTFKGRWFNGEAGLDIRFADGELMLKPVSLEVRGNKVSAATLRAMSTPEAMQQLNESLREKMQKDPKLAETMRKVESVDIKENKLVIVADGSGGAAEEEKEDKTKV